MYEAARQGDHVEHSYALEGLLLGLAAGVIVGAICVATGGAGLALVATAASLGGGLGEQLGHLFHHADETIITGSTNVLIGKSWAARGKADLLDKHLGQVVAQGSRTVFIQDFPAARIDDKTQCDGKIVEGCSTVQIGKAPGTYVKIGREVPLWLEIGVQVLGLAGMVGEMAALKEISVLGEERALVESEQVATEEVTTANATSEETAATNITEETNATSSATEETAANKTATTEGEPTPGESSSAPKEQCSRVGEPVDVATGNVVTWGTDLSLPGLIPIAFQRHYTSAHAGEQSSLGHGWSHTFEQWISEGERVITLRDDDGRDIYFSPILSGESTFHRRERLTLSAERDGRYTVHSAKTRLLRTFAPLVPGGRAMLRSIRDAHENVITLYYDEERLIRIIDTAGREIHFQSDNAGQVTRIEVCARGALQQWVDYEHHPGGELASVIDALGHAERFEYDERHRMIKAMWKNDVSFHYAYDSKSGRCVRTWGDGGLHTFGLSYDLERRITETRGTEQSTIYYWNTLGTVVREETPDGRCLRTVMWDPDGYILAEGIIAAELTRYEYDARGNRTRVIDAAGNETVWEYKGDQPVRCTRPDGLVTTYEHDYRGALTAVTYPSNLRYELSYDLYGKLSMVREGDSVVARFGYDGEHNVVREIDARGAATEYGYDALARPIARKDALGRETRVEYDTLGQPVAIYAADGTVTRSEYEPLGNVMRFKDALGQVTEMEYAGTGTLTRVIQSDGQAWSLRYNRDERLVEIQNPHGEPYAFTHDSAGRVASETTFDGRTLTYKYSDTGRLSSVEYPDQVFRLFQHDPLGNIVHDSGIDSQVSFERDKFGRMMRATLEERSGKVVTEFERDRLGRVVEERQNGQAIRYAYNDRGRRIERVLPDGSITRYGYAAAGDLASIEHDGRRFALDRDALGREVTRRAEGGGVEIRSAYDEMDRLVARNVAGEAAHAALSGRTWKYDALGRVQEIGDSRWGTTQYQYDRIGQLVEAKRGAYHEVFQYDITGSLRNILSGLTPGGNARPWDTEPGNLLARTETARYDYDKRGRRVKKIALVDAKGGNERAGDVTEYIWDERDRLREVKKPNGDRVLFTYDAFSRRVRKEVLAEEEPGACRVVEFLWDGDKLAEDMDSRRGTRVFVHEPGTFVPILQAEQGEVFAVVNDHLGMPKELIDQDGRVAWSAVHSAWGKVLSEQGDPSIHRERTIENPFRLLGQYADEETQLCYTRFRYFDADIGRWCAPDPLGLVGGLNLYQFDGAPTVNVDPLGLAAEGCSSAGKMQKEVERDQAPRDIDRVDRGHIEGQEDHVHYTDGTSSTQSGGIHDRFKGIPNPSKAARKWLEKHGWTPPPKL